MRAPAGSPPPPRRRALTASERISSVTSTPSTRTRGRRSRCPPLGPASATASASATSTPRGQRLAGHRPVHRAGVEESPARAARPGRAPTVDLPEPAGPSMAMTRSFIASAARSLEEAGVARGDGARSPRCAAPAPTSPPTAAAMTMRWSPSASIVEGPRSVGRTPVPRSKRSSPSPRAAAPSARGQAQCGLEAVGLLEAQLAHVAKGAHPARRRGGHRQDGHLVDRRDLRGIDLGADERRLAATTSSRPASVTDDRRATRPCARGRPRSRPARVIAVEGVADRDLRVGVHGARRPRRRRPGRDQPGTSQRCGASDGRASR